MFQSMCCFKKVKLGKFAFKCDLYSNDNRSKFLPRESPKTSIAQKSLNTPTNLSITLFMIRFHYQFNLKISSCRKIAQYRTHTQMDGAKLSWTRNRLILPLYPIAFCSFPSPFCNQVLLGAAVPLSQASLTVAANQCHFPA